MVIKLIKEMRAHKKREEIYKGILKMKEYMDEMRASGEYSDEQMKNIERWWAAACVEYAKMF